MNQLISATAPVISTLKHPNWHLQLRAAHWKAFIPNHFILHISFVNYTWVYTCKTLWPECDDRYPVSLCHTGMCVGFSPAWVNQQILSHVPMHPITLRRQEIWSPSPQLDIYSHMRRRKEAWLGSVCVWSVWQAFLYVCERMCVLWDRWKEHTRSLDSGVRITVPCLSQIRSWRVCCRHFLWTWIDI